MQQVDEIQSVAECRLQNLAKSNSVTSLPIYEEPEPPRQPNDTLVGESGFPRVLIRFSPDQQKRSTSRDDEDPPSTVAPPPCDNNDDEKELKHKLERSPVNSGGSLKDDRMPSSRTTSATEGVLPSPPPPPHPSSPPKASFYEISVDSEYFDAEAAAAAAHQGLSPLPTPPPTQAPRRPKGKSVMTGELKTGWL